MAVTEGMLGWGAIVGAAEETTWATAVTPSTHWIPIESCTLDADEKVEDSPTLGFVNTQPSHNVRDFALLAHDAGGDLTHIPTYDGKYSAMLLKHCFGTVATTGAGPYTHTLKLDTDALVGLTLQNLYGHHSSLSAAEIFRGCLVNTFEFAVDSRSFARLKCGILAERAAGMTAVSGTPTTLDKEEVIGSHVGSLTWNATTHQLSKLSVMVDKKLVRRPFLGSKYTDKPQPGAPMEVIVRATLDWTSHDLYTALLAGTQGDGTLNMVGSGNNQLQWALGNMVVRKCKKPISRAGVLTFDVEWRCFASATGTEEGLQVAVINDNASFT